LAIYDFGSNNEVYSSLNVRADNRPQHSIFNPQQSQYNPNVPDIAVAEHVALESIRIAGVVVTVLLRTDDGKYDKVWNEDISPTYYSGYDFKAWFAPSAPEIVLTKFGQDAPHSIDLLFSRAEVLHVLGDRLIRIGDIVVIPHNSLAIRASRFRVVHATDFGNYRYRWIYWSVTVESMNKDDATLPMVK